MLLSSTSKSITGQKAFNICIDKIFSLGDTIWLKFGHNYFYKGEIGETTITLKKTKGKEKERQLGQIITDGYNYLKRLCETQEGGCFFLPGKPDSLPLKEFCLQSNDVGAEMDDGDQDSQLKRIEFFSEVSGLTPGLVISSGGKSLHPHWLLKEDIPMEKVIYLKRLLTIALLSDPSVTRPHQPMRIAGFFRKEKGKEQALIYHSSNKYSYEEMLEGFKRYFTYLRYQFPELITDEWWRDNDEGLVPIITANLTHREKQSRLRYVLAKGLKKYEYDVLHQKQQGISKRAKKLLTQSTNFLDLIQEASDRLGQDAFNWPGHNWKYSGDKARGYCPWHESKSGTAGWISPPRNGHGWGYACPTCTDNRPISAFSYWWYLQNGLNAPYPKGKDFITAVKDFCEWAGIEFPETKWNPMEPDWEAYQEYLQWEEEQEKVEEAIANEEFKIGLVAKMAKLGSGFLKGMGILCEQRKVVLDKIKAPKVIHYNPDYPLPSPRDYKDQPPPKIIFKKNQRLSLILGLNRQGWQIIWDKSMTGSGKSHDTGLINNPDGRTIYIDINHRNPSTKSVEEKFTDLIPRHNGLYRDVDGKIKRSGKKLVQESNCHKTEDFLKLHNKGYFLGSAKNNPVCLSCPYFERCEKSHGVGHGYRYLRNQTLQKSQIRCHPGSLPPELNYHSDVAIVEEASKTLSLYQTLHVNLADLNNQMIAIAINNLQLFNELYPIFKFFSPYLDKTKPIQKYGVDKYQILGDFSNNLDMIVTQDLIKRVEKEKLSVMDIYQNIDTIFPDFLIPLLKILSGERGSIRVTQSGLTITSPNNQISDTLKEMRLVVLLEATGYKPALAAQLNTSENNIITIEQEEPKSNLIVHQVEMPGLGSNQWSKALLERISKVTTILQEKHPDLSSYALKTYCDTLGFDRWWFNHNRGDNNDFGKSAIAAFGSPFLNYGAVEDEFYTLGLSGNPQDYYKQIIQSEITQLLGRLRSHRFPNRTFHIYLFGTNMDLTFLEGKHQIVKEHISQICPEGDSEFNQTTYRLFTAAKEIMDSGVKLTQKAIAEVLGITQAAISQQLKVRSLSTKELAYISQNIRFPINDTIKGTYVFWNTIKMIFEKLADSIVFSSYELQSKP